MGGALRRVAVVAGCAVVLFAVAIRVARPTLDWPDRRPIGALFLASHAHVSGTNPRGWFNEPGLDLRGPAGMAGFRRAMIEYADRSISILRRTGAQGMIVWDLEGEEFPHKITYVGDPRWLNRLAPEAGPAADDFFERFRNAGFRVGLTIRPQEFSLDARGNASQTDVRDYDRILLEKIDYARKRWGATLFYVDSNSGARRPAEAVQLRRVAQQRPDVLLIPEHHYLPFYGFSAPYGSMEKGAGPTSGLIRAFYPQSFQVLAVPESVSREGETESAYRNGDVLLFRAWFSDWQTRVLEGLANR